MHLPALLDRHEGGSKQTLGDDRGVQHVGQIREICQVKSQGTLLEDEGAHNPLHRLHHIALYTEAEIGHNGNLFPHRLVACPAIVLAELGMVGCEQGQGIEGPGGDS